MSASLSDRLNPTHPAFDADLKARWATMPRKERAAAAKVDLDALAARAAAAPVMAEHPFPVDEDDHCETPAEAYADIASVLHRLAAIIGVAASKLRIWDPYFCNGAVKRHLADAGFSTVHNEPEDFYAVVREGKAPAFDVLLTNPAYSGDHIPRLLDICGKLGAVSLMLMPNYVAGKPYFAAAQKRWPASIGRTLFLVPPKRYSYWTPKGLRSKTQSHASAAGHRTSPFVSFWYACLGPHEAAVLKSLRFGADSGAAATAAPAAGGAGAASSASPTACRLRMFRSVAVLPKGVRPSLKDEPVAKVSGGGDGRAQAAAESTTIAGRTTLPSATSSAASALAGAAAGGAAAAGKGDAPVTGAKRLHEAAADSNAPGGKRRRDSDDDAAAASSTAAAVSGADRSAASVSEEPKRSKQEKKETRDKKERKEKKQKMAAAGESAEHA